MLKDKINILEGTTNSLTDLRENASMNELITYLEKEFPDSSFFFDVSLNALIETLEYNGFTEKQIVKMCNTFYGNYIIFHYYTDLELYVLEIGQ